MKNLFFSLILGFHHIGHCDFSVKCQFITHETVYTDTGEVFRKADNPYIIGLKDPVLTISKHELRIQDPVIPSRFFLAGSCKSQPVVLGYDCFAIKNYINGKVPAIYISKDDRQTALLKSPVGAGLLGETQLTNIDYYSCPN